MSPNNSALRTRISTVLHEKFSVRHLEIHDKTHLHAGHAEFKKNQGAHFSILIVSQDFEKKRPLERHRMIYGPLKEAFKSDIHALAIKALTVEEFEQNPA
jgi:BolA protein